MPDEKCVLDPSRECIGKTAAVKLEARIENLERWKDSSHEFHEKFYTWQREQDIKSAKLDERLKNMDANILKVVTYQEEQQKKPAKRWDAIVEKVLLLIVAGVVGVILARVGLS